MTRGYRRPLGEAAQPAFHSYGGLASNRNLLLCERLAEHGLDLVSGGSDTTLASLTFAPPNLPLDPGKRGMSVGYAAMTVGRGVLGCRWVSRR